MGATAIINSAKLPLLLAAIWTILFILRTAGDTFTPGLWETIGWQLLVWLPWAAFGPIQARILRKRPAEQFLSLPGISLHLALIMVICALHTGWFAWISTLFSPYRHLEVTQFGVFRFIFILWVVCDILVYVALSLKIFADLAARQFATIAAEASHGPTNGTIYVERLSVPTSRGRDVIDIQSVSWIEAQDYYARIHTRDNRYMIRLSLNRIFERLDPARFVRIHRSTIVNIRAVRKLERLDTGSYNVELKDGAVRAVSRTGIGPLKAALSDLT